MRLFRQQDLRFDNMSCRPMPPCPTREVRVWISRGSTRSDADFEGAEIPADKGRPSGFSTRIDVTYIYIYILYIHIYIHTYYYYYYY